MRKKILFAVLPIFILSCNFLIPQQDKNPLPASPEVATARSTLSTPQVSSTSSFAIVTIHTQDGDLSTQLSAEAQKAKGRDLNPFIEFDATWCPPCQAIEKSIKAKDPLTMQALKGVYLIRADVDEWSAENGKKFNFDAIPVYYQLDTSGRPTGAVVDGGAWGEDIPENFAPVLDKFFHTP